MGPILTSLMKIEGPTSNMHSLSRIGGEKIRERDRLFQLLVNQDAISALIDKRTIGLLDRIGVRSPYLSEVLIMTLAEFPHLREELIGIGKLEGAKNPDSMRTELDAFMEGAETFEQQRDMMRFYKSREILRIGLTHIIERKGTQVSRELATLGKTLLSKACEVSDPNKRPGYAILVRGSYSRGATSFHSDLDIICVGSDDVLEYGEITSRVKGLMGSLSRDQDDEEESEGILARRSLTCRYDIDTSTNPGDELFVTEKDFVNSLMSTRTNALSRLKALEFRFVAGDRKFAERVLHATQEAVLGRQDGIVEAIDERVENHASEVTRLNYVCLSARLTGLVDSVGVMPSLAELMIKGYLDRNQYVRAEESFDRLMFFRNEAMLRYGYPFISRPNGPPEDLKARTEYARGLGYAGVTELDSEYLTNHAALEAIREIIKARIKIG